MNHYHYYFYLWDPDWGGSFFKTNAYAPYPIWFWLNGHSWAQRQLDKAGIAYEALDNGFCWCADPRALQRICDRLGPGAVKTFFWRWQRRLPSPFTRADLRAGYVYDLAFRQFEVSDTRVFDHPQAGRAFFEGVIRDHLDVGRPSLVSLIFSRRVDRRTPGTFATKVITKGVEPEICCYYRSSRIKQYFIIWIGWQESQCWNGFFRWRHVAHVAHRARWSWQPAGLGCGQSVVGRTAWRLGLEARCFRFVPDGARPVRPPGAAGGTRPRPAGRTAA